MSMLYFIHHKLHEGTSLNFIALFLTYTEIKKGSFCRLLFGVWSFVTPEGFWEKIVAVVLALHVGALWAYCDPRRLTHTQSCQVSLPADCTGSNE